jgi:flagellar capping protein FliD
MTSQSTDPKDVKTIDVSAETKALVEQKMGDEPDDIKHHMMALIEAIKHRASEQLEATGEMTKETYVSAMRQAKDTLNKTEGFFQEQKNSLSQTIDDVENTTTQRWETMLQDMKEMGNRLDRAVSAAWKILTEPDSKSESSPDPSDDKSDES